jgi:hypothetical protein
MVQTFVSKQCIKSTLNVGTADDLPVAHAIFPKTASQQGPAKPICEIATSNQADRTHGVM